MCCFSYSSQNNADYYTAARKRGTLLIPATPWLVKLLSFLLPSFSSLSLSLSPLSLSLSLSQERNASKFAVWLVVLVRSFVSCRRHDEDLCEYTLHAAVS